MSFIPHCAIPATVQAVQDATSSTATDRLRGRTIVLCLDGTGDQFDEDNSNIVKVFQALRKDDPRQICFYQAGLGTYTSATKGSMKRGLSAALDMAVGASLDTHVKEAYSFLMNNYQEGDRICLFGFSRGAYTARALAGMLHKVGLLPAHNQAQIVFAWHYYKLDTKYGWTMSSEFKRTFSIDVNIHFLGCWDTVASVGIIPRILPFAKTNNTSVRYFRHALALDERRAKFKPAFWLQRVPQTAAQKQEDKEHQEMEEEHAKRSAGAGRGVHVDDQGRFSNYGSYGSIDLSRITRVLDGPVMQEPEEQDSPQDSRATSSRDSSIGRRGSLLNRRLSLPPPIWRRSSSPSFGNDSEEVLMELPGDAERKAAKVRKSQKQVNLMNEFNEKDEQEWGRPTHDTDVLEVFFAGAHADIGGGSVPNVERHMISRIPLRWMLRQSFLCDTGILWRSDVLAEHGLDVNTLYPKVLPREPAPWGPAPSDLDRYAKGELPSLESRRMLLKQANDDRELRALRERIGLSVTSPNSEASTVLVPPAHAETDLAPKPPHHEVNPQPKTDASFDFATVSPISMPVAHAPKLDVLPEVYEDYFDCQASINDQLKQSKPWWILELFCPVKYRVKQADGTWVKKLGPNLGRHRTVRQDNPNLHWSVVQRSKLLGYEIKAEMNDQARWNIVM